MREPLLLQESLPVGSGARSTGWWGIWLLILTEGSLFGYLLLSYFYLALQSPEHWPLEGPPALRMPAINTVILLMSSAFVYGCEWCVRRSRQRLGVAAMAVAILLGAAFVGIQLHEWRLKAYGLTTHLYGSLYFTITGFHMAHVVIGLIILALLLLWTALGYFGARRSTALRIGGLYWHFVDAVWLVIFTSLYLFPYFGRQ